MKLNQEWEKEWESIDVPKAELFQIIDEQIGKQTTKKKIKISNFLSQLGKYPAAIAVVGIVIFSLILIIFYQGGPIGQNAGQFSKEEASQQVADSQIPAPAAAKNESAVNDSAVNLPEEKSKNAQFYTMTKRTEKLDLANDKLKKIVQKFDGYIEKSTLQKPENGSWEQQSSYYKLRIPKKQSEKFMESLDEIGTTTSEEVQTENFSTVYSDNQSRIDALKTEEQALLDLLAKSDALDDMLKIQERLATIREERENLTRMNQGIDNQVEYITFELTVEEKKSSEKEKKNSSVFTLIQKNWNNQKSFWSEAGKKFLVFIASNFAYLILLFIGGIIFYSKRKKNRKL